VVTVCTAQWSLYVPHSGHYMYRTVVTIWTAQWSLYVPHSGHYMYHQINIHNSTFCPHSVFMCFVWIWEQTAITSLYSINWLCFRNPKLKCLRCMVFWYILKIFLSLFFSFFHCHFIFRTLCPVSPSSKICCAPNCGACTYVALGSRCETAVPTAPAATTVTSPWKLTAGWRPASSVRFPLTSLFGSPYTAVTRTGIIYLIKVHIGKEPVSIAQHDAQVDLDKKMEIFLRAVLGLSDTWLQ
jgi:hypothetical protein